MHEKMVQMKKTKEEEFAAKDVDIRELQGRNGYQDQQIRGLEIAAIVEDTIRLPFPQARSTAFRYPSYWSACFATEHCDCMTLHPLLITHTGELFFFDTMKMGKPYSKHPTC